MSLKYCFSSCHRDDIFNDHFSAFKCDTVFGQGQWLAPFKPLSAMFSTPNNINSRLSVLAGIQNAIANINCTYIIMGGDIIVGWGSNRVVLITIPFLFSINFYMG